METCKSIVAISFRDDGFPVTRLENARTDAGGTGVGLAIVERIARLHEGRLELLQRTGGGLIARLKIPLKNQA